MAELAGNGLNLRRADRSVWFWLQRGWLDDPALADGTDDTIAQAEGRVPRGRKRRVRPLELRGWITGIGITPLAADVAFLALLTELRPIFFDLSVDPWPLVAADQYRGLAAGQTATILVRPVSIAPAAGQLTWRRHYSIALESVSSPPEWVIAP